MDAFLEAYGVRRDCVPWYGIAYHVDVATVIIRTGTVGLNKALYYSHACTYVCLYITCIIYLHVMQDCPFLAPPGKPPGTLPPPSSSSAPSTSAPSSHEPPFPTPKYSDGQVAEGIGAHDESTIVQLEAMTQRLHDVQNSLGVNESGNSVLKLLQLVRSVKSITTGCTEIEDVADVILSRYSFRGGYVVSGEVISPLELRPLSGTPSFHIQHIRRALAEALSY
jgi:hypothetical protein